MIRNLFKKPIIILLAVLLLLTGCGAANESETPEDQG